MENTKMSVAILFLVGPYFAISRQMTVIIIFSTFENILNLSTLNAARGWMGTEMKRLAKANI